MLSSSHFTASMGRKPPVGRTGGKHFYNGISLAVNLILECLLNGLPGGIDIFTLLTATLWANATPSRVESISQTLTG